MARTRRALNPNNGSGFYHVISRVVGGEFLLEEEKKEVFTSLMRKTAAFCGIEIVTHVVMSNHYHILLEVPPRQELSESEILVRYKGQVSETQYKGNWGRSKSASSSGSSTGRQRRRPSQPRRLLRVFAPSRETSSPAPAPVPLSRIRSPCQKTGNFRKGFALIRCHMEYR